MKRYLYILICAVFICKNAEAYDGYAQSFDNPLSQSEKSALKKLESISNNAIDPKVFNVGQVQFTYGASIPTVICAVLEITDINLEPGEHILSVQIGDGARWSVESAISGADENSIEHIILKPLDMGLKTSLLIATDRRSYHIRLKSTQKDFMPMVNFFYPKSAYKQKTFEHISPANKGSDNSYQYTKNSNSSRVQMASYKEQPSFNLVQGSTKNYAYEITGDDNILPVNAYDDGRKTYIQMGLPFGSSPVPALMQVTKGEGIIFKDENLALINFRVSGDTLIVDGIYDHLRLLSSNNNYQADIKRES